MEVSVTEDITSMDMSDGPESNLHGVFLKGQVVINYVDAQTGNLETATLSLTPEQLTTLGLPANEISISAEDGHVDPGSIGMNLEHSGTDGAVISLSEETTMYRVNHSECNVHHEAAKEEASETCQRKCDMNKPTRLDILNMEETEQNVCDEACVDEVSSGGLEQVTTDVANGGKWEKHIKILENDKEIFRCETCGKTYPTKSSLLSHKTSHTDDSAKADDDDSFQSLNQSTGVSKHIENLISKCPMACAYCGKTFAIKINLKIHRRRHKGEKPFQCVFCDECFISKSELLEHMEKHNEENQHKCHTCERSFNSRENLREHEKSNDTCRNGVVQTSEKVVKSQKELSEHSKIHTGPESPNKHLIESAESSRAKTKPRDQTKQNTIQIEHVEQSRKITEYEDLDSLSVQTESSKSIIGENAFSCKICKKEFSDNVTAINHAKTHSDEKPFRCGLCGKCFPGRSHLFRHIKSHSAGGEIFKRKDCLQSSATNDTPKDYAPAQSGENQYKCKYCDKYLANRSSLAAHERRHFAVKSYKCEYCGKGFTEGFSLKSHIRIHTGEKPYKCQYCNKAFVDGSRLSRHKKIHENIKKKTYICEYCGRCFKRANNLGLHKHLKHDVETPYKCEECGKHYACPTTLKTHKRLHSGVKPYKCQFCDDSFISAGRLSTHIKSHTREENNQL